MKLTHPSNTSEGKLVYSQGRVAGFIEIKRYGNHVVLLQKIFVDDFIYGIYSSSWVRGKQGYRKLRTEFESVANSLQRNAGMIASLVRRIETETELRTLKQINAQLSEFVA